MRFIFRSSVFAMVFFLLGCSSARTVSGGDSQELASIAFSGTRLNLAYWYCRYPDGGEAIDYAGYTFLITVYLVPDFVLSLATDIVFFPYYIYQKNELGGPNFPELECDDLSKYFG